MNPVPLLAVLLFVSSPCTENLLTNPTFDNGLVEWKIASGEAEIAFASEDGNGVSRIRSTGGDRTKYPRLYQDFNVAPGDKIHAHVRAKGMGVSGGHGVYTSIGYLTKSGERLSYVQSERVDANNEWKTLRVRGIVPEGVARARYSLILNGKGVATFDDAFLCLEKAPPAVSEATKIELLVTDEVACASLIGFGAEDDGWFYNEMNAEWGVTAEDANLREGRIEWMDPDWVRMFFWHRDWCPSGDWETFTFDSGNMESHYRTLDLYQRIGAVVNVVGVEWGMKDPYSDPGRFASAVGSLLEHLIREKGFTCIRQWTLTNEPNHSFINLGYDFNHFVAIHKAVSDEFAQRGLEIEIVGSDDAQGFSWFSRCVEEASYKKVVSLFASHKYFKRQDRAFVNDFLEDRLKQLEREGIEKPFVVAEFGFQDGRSGTLVNPLMESYPYALWASDFAIRGLNRGFAGSSIWCLHEVVYPGGGFMNYGLWDYKDNEWAPRPVYHAWSQFSRLIERGDNSIVCVSSHPDQFQAAWAGETLFWVHHGNGTIEVQVDGPVIGEVRSHTEGSLMGDRESGTVSKIQENSFVAPPLSFGYARALD